MSAQSVFFSFIPADESITNVLAAHPLLGLQSADALEALGIAADGDPPASFVIRKKEKKMGTLICSSLRRLQIVTPEDQEGCR